MYLPFDALPAAQSAELRAFIGNMSANANQWFEPTVAKSLSYSSDHFEYFAFLIVQRFLELLLGTVDASAVTCLFKQSMQC